MVGVTENHGRIDSIAAPRVCFSDWLCGEIACPLVPVVYEIYHDIFV